MLKLAQTVFIVTFVASAAADDAQQAQPGHGKGLGLGLGRGAMSVGDETRSSFGASLLGHLSLDSRNRFILTAEVNPLKVSSPIIDESLRAINLLLGFNIGRSFRVRPGIGVQFRSWSGSQRVVPRDFGPLLGLDAGPQLRRGRRVSLSPEVVLRSSLIELEGGVGSSFIGVQLVASWRRAPR